MNFRHWAIIIILMHPAFSSQLLKDFGIVLHKLEEIHNKNIKKISIWPELFTMKCTSIDGQLGSATDPSLWHMLRTRQKASRVI